MSGETTARDERASNRRRRRGEDGSAAPTETEATPHLQEALLAAASAAAIGAAVGAARAYSSRRHEGDASAEQPDEDEGVEGTDARTAEPEPAAEAELEEIQSEEPEPDKSEPKSAELESDLWGPAASRDEETQDGDRRRDVPESGADEPADERSEAPPGPASPDALRRIVADARHLLQELDGKDAESVSSVSQTAGGWTVALEVVEVSRIPDSTDVLATYEVELDPDGGVRRFDRIRRYRRSDAGRGA